MDTFSSILSFLSLQAVLAVALTISADAGTFECESVAPDEEGHQHVYQFLSGEMGIAPVEIVYCQHDRFPRWMARWLPFEEISHQGEKWLRYATASCSDKNGDFRCRTKNHVVAGKSHVVIDVPDCDIDIGTIAAIHDAVPRDYPGHEMKEIEFVSVLDGGAWSPSTYGFKVSLNKPPKYEGGPTREFVQSCEAGECMWHDNGGAGTWMGGSTELQRLRRMRGDPLIEYLEP